VGTKNKQAKEYQERGEMGRKTKKKKKSTPTLTVWTKKKQNWI